MLSFILAQTADHADKAVGLAERLAQGGVAVICLVIAIVAALAAVYQYRKNAELEAAYRTDLDNRAKKAEADAEKRLTKAEADADKRAIEAEKAHDKLQKVEKESDVTLAAAVRTIENDAELFEKVRPLLERVLITLDRVERKLGG